MRALLYRSSIVVAVVSAIFVVVVGAILAVNQFHLVKTDPLNASSIEQLKERFREAPDDSSLTEEIRQLDLLARRAWFSSVRFQERGVLLLLSGSLLLIVSLKTVVTLRAGPRGRGRGREKLTLTRKQGLLMAASIAAGAAAVLWLAGGDSGEHWAAKVSPERSEAEIPGLEKRSGDGNAADEWWQSAGRQWPSFRGPGGTARAAEGNWPTSWDGAAGTNIAWKAPIPVTGRSSPVVWDDRVFLSGGDEGSLEVLCYSAQTGDLLWRYQLEEEQPPWRPEVAGDTGHAAPTMAADGQRVYAVFSTGDLVALGHNGSLVWRYTFELPDNPYGHASSLVAYGDRLVVLYDHRGSASIMALEGATGEVAWETFRDMDISWTSPIIARLPGGDQVVVSGNPYVAGYDPYDGAELWRVAALSGEVASSPAWAGTMVAAANEFATLTAISLGGEPEITWEYDLDLPEVSSVLATGQRIYMANGAGIITCLSQENGEVLWRREMAEGFYASPVLAGGNIYLLDRTGTMHIFADAGEYRPVALAPLGEISNSTAAFVDGRIFIRGEEHLFCISKTAP
jgi:outer membrane protein assembly factor BamB